MWDKGIQDVVTKKAITELRKKAQSDRNQNRKKKQGNASENYELLKQFAVGPQQLRVYYDRFQEVDKEDTGSINYEEFCLVLEEEDNDLMRNLFDIFDLDDSGTLEMQEMIIGLSAYCADVSPVERWVL